MNDHILDNILSIQFKDTVLIPIKIDVTKLFGTNKVEFQILIKDKKIVIESPKILASQDIQNNTPAQEAINV